MQLTPQSKAVSALKSPATSYPYITHTKACTSPCINPISLPSIEIPPDVADKTADHGHGRTPRRSRDPDLARIRHCCPSIREFSALEWCTDHYKRKRSQRRSSTIGWLDGLLNSVRRSDGLRFRGLLAAASWGTHMLLVSLRVGGSYQQAVRLQNWFGHFSKQE